MTVERRFAVGKFTAMGIGAAKLSVPATQSASLLSAGEARVRAIAILKGDPYGSSDAEVAGSIKQAYWVEDGNTTACGRTRRPVWAFHVVVVTDKKDQFNNGIIDGYLVLDARAGNIRCTSLPSLG